MYAFQEGKVKRRVNRASVCNFVISSLRGSFKSDHAQLHVPLKHQLVGGLRKKDRIRHFHKEFIDCEVLHTGWQSISVIMYGFTVTSF